MEAARAFVKGYGTASTSQRKRLLSQIDAALENEGLLAPDSLSLVEGELVVVFQSSLDQL